MKFHYCDKDYGKGESACQKGPPPNGKDCERFFASQGNKMPSDVEDVRLELQGGKTVMCHSQQNPEEAKHGWCHVTGNYYDAKNTDYNYRSWGFCGKDCFLDTGGPGTGVMRKKTSIHILPETLCSRFLNDSLSSQGVKTYPEILCIAEQNRWKEETWKETGSGFQKVQEGEVRRYGTTSYVASVGTCQGDSGGPVFVEEYDRFVVTGVVSGGRGELGDCGGVNNPIHYARVKRLTNWILEILDQRSTDQLCWDTEFQTKVVERCCRKRNK